MQEDLLVINFESSGILSQGVEYLPHIGRLNLKQGCHWRNSLMGFRWSDFFEEERLFGRLVVTFSLIRYSFGLKILNRSLNSSLWTRVC